MCVEKRMDSMNKNTYVNKQKLPKKNHLNKKISNVIVSEFVNI